MSDSQHDNPHQRKAMTRIAEVAAYFNIILFALVVTFPLWKGVIGPALDIAVSQAEVQAKISNHEDRIKALEDFFPRQLRRD